ncbi:MAG TPA: hypothetical protein P5048_04720 [Chlamydiales bacterium]|nr:hypothetical protein [Chlamydiales bacterium]
MPKIKIYYFLFLLIYSIRKQPLLNILPLSIFIGLFYELFATTPFGLFAIAYPLTTLLLFKAKNFFNDNPLNDFLFTTLYSLSLTAVMSIVGIFLGIQHTFSFSFFFMNFCLYPFIDGTFALILFSIPFIFFNICLNYYKIQFKKRRYKLGK